MALSLTRAHEIVPVPFRTPLKGIHERIETELSGVSRPAKSFRTVTSSYSKAKPLKRTVQFPKQAQFTRAVSLPTVEDGLTVVRVEGTRRIPVRLPVPSQLAKHKGAAL